MTGWPSEEENKYSIIDFTKIPMLFLAVPEVKQTDPTNHTFPTDTSHQTSKSTKTEKGFSTISRNFKDLSLFPKWVFKNWRKKRTPERFWAFGWIWNRGLWCGCCCCCCCSSLFLRKDHDLCNLSFIWTPNFHNAEQISE